MYLVILQESGPGYKILLTLFMINFAYLNKNFGISYFLAGHQTSHFNHEYLRCLSYSFTRTCLFAVA